MKIEKLSDKNDSFIYLIPTIEINNCFGGYRSVNVLIWNWCINIYSKWGDSNKND